MKNLPDRVRHDQVFMMYHICPNIRQLWILGSSLFPTWVFRGGKLRKFRKYNNNSLNFHKCRYKTKNNTYNWAYWTCEHDKLMSHGIALHIQLLETYKPLLERWPLLLCAAVSKKPCLMQGLILKWNSTNHIKLVVMFEEIWISCFFANRLWLLCWWFCQLQT
jgi:hypothetical protein